MLRREHYSKKVFQDHINSTHNFKEKKKDRIRSYPRPSYLRVFSAFVTLLFLLTGWYSEGTYGNKVENQCAEFNKVDKYSLVNSRGYLFAQEVEKLQDSILFTFITNENNLPVERFHEELYSSFRLHYSENDNVRKEGIGLLDLVSTGNSSRFPLLYVPVRCALQSVFFYIHVLILFIIGSQWCIS